MVGREPVYIQCNHIASYEHVTEADGYCNAMHILNDTNAAFFQWHHRLMWPPSSNSLTSLVYTTKYVTNKTNHNHLPVYCRQHFHGYKIQISCEYLVFSTVDAGRTHGCVSVQGCDKTLWGQHGTSHLVFPHLWLRDVCRGHCLYPQHLRHVSGHTGCRWLVHESTLIGCVWHRRGRHCWLAVCCGPRVSLLFMACRSWILSTNTCTCFSIFY